MIKAGITGGIGSGKSMICRIFAMLNVPGYNADAEARILTDTDPEIRKGLITLAGDHLFQGKSLNRSLLAEYIFQDKSLLEKVNKLIHPRVAAHFADWCSKNADHPYIIQESAILFESGFYRLFDKIVTVSAPENLRIRRVVMRKGMTPEKIKVIIQNQMPEEEKIRRSDYTIINDGKMPVLPQVLKLHQLFISTGT